MKSFFAGLPLQKVSQRVWGLTADYLTALNVPILAGRGLVDGDNSDALPVPVVNEQLARQEWPGDNPIGKQIRLRRDPGVKRTIVGIVRDARFNTVSIRNNVNQMNGARFNGAAT